MARASKTASYCLRQSHVVLFLCFQVAFSFAPKFHTQEWALLPLRATFSRSKTFSLSASTKQASSTNAKIVYQKVVRPSKVLPELLFLGYLVEYLESHFQLPTKLPMTYESFPCSDEDRCILAWDSPLSPSPGATRLEVEVIGVYTGDEKGSSKNETQSDNTVQSKISVPNMAMVVVRKSESSFDPLPPMMQNLFADSEKKILRMLDRGLEEFIAGRIQFHDYKDDSKASKIPNVKTAEQAIQAELVDELPSYDSTQNPAEDVILETTATVDVETSTTVSNKNKDSSPNNKPAGSRSTIKTPPEAARDAALRSMKIKVLPKTSPRNTDGSPLSGDYAIQAAMAAAKNRSGPSRDYAVAAAAKISKSRKATNTKTKSHQSAKQKPSQKRPTIQKTPTAEKTIPTLEEALRQNKSADSIAGSMGSFHTVISRPSDRLKKKRKTQELRNSERTKSHKTAGNDALHKTSGNKPRERPMPSKNFDTNRNVNLNVVEDDSADYTGTPSAPTTAHAKVNATNQQSKKVPSPEQIERDIMEAAQNVMSDLADQGQDMTPEELLQDVLKFDQEQTKENAAGTGFVSGAFEKAKELLRAKNALRQTRLQEKAVKEISNNINNISPDVVSLDGQGADQEEDELKRLFKAGEHIADGRIAKAYADQVEVSSDAKEVDALIAQEKSISSHSRVLDDELAELELRINKSPGEELDGPRKNQIFDIFSGPEVYNPNVDPETINFPGALPGRKNVRLPQELDEAVKQAKFAADVLTKLRVNESKDANGVKIHQYFAGERELSHQQVQNLERLVAEATEIGLIENPVKLMRERSNLQMVLDELWQQPNERFHDIASNFKDLLLSDNLVMLINERLNQMADRDLDALRRDDESLEESHARERELLGQLVVYAQVLLKEARALGAELEAQQLEVIRSICKVAMDPSHVTEEETAMALTDAVRDMRPLLDDAFVAYLKYAIAEEEGRLARAGVLDDPEHNHWLFVLKVVQQGVHTEIARGINRYLEHIWYVLRMETSVERRMLLEKLIDDMPTLDVRPFVNVVDNIVGSLGDAARGEFDGVTALGEMTNKLLQLHRDVKELLPPDRIALKSRDADEWAAKQKQKLLEHKKLTKQRLKAASDTAHLEGEIESLGRRGEIERID